MTDLVSTAPDPRNTPPKTLLQEIEEFVNANVRIAPHEAGHLIAKFLLTTKLAPALDGEPVFVLRAQDKIAPSQVLSWADDADRHEAHDKAEGARVIAHQMIAWQMAHQARVKTPD